MTLPQLLLVFTFLESAASTGITRGVYFFTNDKLHFTPLQNLYLALGAGAFYVAGAISSHALARRLGEKRVLLISLGAQTLCLAALAAAPSPATIVAGLMAYQVLSAAMWPVVESYISAGQSPRETSSAVGAFNICWATAAPVGVWSSGAIISKLGAGLFGVGAGVTVLGALFLVSVPLRPAHHADDHPDRPPAESLRLYRGLLLSSRWSLVLGYALLYVLAPVLPSLFKGLGLGIAIATLLAGCIDAARAAMFVVMSRTHRWHGRRHLLFVSAALLPAGFLGALFGGNIWIIVAGEIAFGVAMGLVYYAALYYAMVVGNASVDSGGAHEGLIGSGFTLGPVAALVGTALAIRWNAPAMGMLAGLTPLLGACAIGSLWPLCRQNSRAGGR